MKHAPDLKSETRLARHVEALFLRLLDEFKAAERVGISSSNREKIEQPIGTFINSWMTECPETVAGDLESISECIAAWLDVRGTSGRALKDRRFSFNALRKVVRSFLSSLREIREEGVSTTNEDSELRLQHATAGVIDALDLVGLDRTNTRLRPAVIVTANDNEGSVLHASIAFACDVESLTLDQLAGRWIWKGEMQTVNGRRPIYLIELVDVGPQTALAAFIDICHAAHPKIVIATGCCGGIPERCSRLKEGAVVVARHVFGYDRQEIEGDTVDFPIPAYRASRELLELVRALNSGKRFGDITVISNRDYASGSAFIDGEGGGLRKEIIDKFPKEVVAFEMEGPGILHGAWELQAQRGDVIVGIVKAMSDASKGDASTDKERRQRKAVEPASVVAIEVIRELKD